MKITNERERDQLARTISSKKSMSKSYLMELVGRRHYVQVIVHRVMSSNLQIKSFSDCMHNFQEKRSPDTYMLRMRSKK